MKGAAGAILHGQNEDGMIPIYRHTKHLARAAIREEAKKQKADVLAVEILQLVRASLLPHLRCMEDARCPRVFILLSNRNL